MRRFMPLRPSLLSCISTPRLKPKLYHYTRRVNHTSSLPTSHCSSTTEHTPKNSNTSHINTTPTAAYDDLVSKAVIRSDSYQRSIVQVLEDLHKTLLTHQFPVVSQPSSSSLLSRAASFLWNKSERSTPAQYGPRGLYLYGSVGTGKTMLMNLFFDTLTFPKKRRVHFHAFMLDIHMRVHKLKTLRHAHYDPIPPIADDLAAESHVLCFDEFQVTDIADAMILRRLFDEIFKRGVVVVTTSNRHPDELYRNGIQRSSFLPCIELLKTRCQVLNLDSGTDYRKAERETGKVFFTPLGPETTQKMENLFRKMTHGNPVTTRTLKFMGRSLIVEKQADRVAWFTFAELCARPLSAADYLAVARQYDTVFISDLPQLTLSQRNEARRFITALDALYESHVTLILSAQVGIFDLFSGEEGGEGSNGELSSCQRVLMDDLGLTLNDVLQTENGETEEKKKFRSPLFSGEEEVFAFQRAVSRLVEMGSREWVLRKRNSRLVSEEHGIEDHGESLDDVADEKAVEEKRS